MNFLKSVFKFIMNILHKIEEYSLVFFLTVMIVFSFLQIILRIFKSSVVWFDSIVNYSVLWVGLIAAGIATTEYKQIKIDLIGKFAKGRFKSFILLIINIVSCTVTLFISYTAIRYIIKIQIPSSDPSPFLNIPVWILILIIPIGFGLIGIKFFVRLIKTIINLIRKNEDYDDSVIKVESINKE